MRHVDNADLVFLADFGSAANDARPGPVGRGLHSKSSIYAELTLHLQPLVYNDSDLPVNIHFLFGKMAPSITGFTAGIVDP
jgi:hypothetical protein